jgi:hypothetical protein
MLCLQHANLITLPGGPIKSAALAYCEALIRGLEERKNRYDVASLQPRRPTAVLIASHNTQVAQQRQQLSSIGFQVKVAHSLLDGYMQTLQMLASPRPALPSVILLDILNIQPGFPELPGSLLAAVLARHMRLEEIHPAWLVGLMSAHDAERETEATVAGCHHILPAPLSDETLVMLHDLVSRPAPVPYLDRWPEQSRIIHVLQNVAVRVLQAVRDAHIDIWTPEDIMHVLGWITRYPTTRSKAEHEAAIASTAYSEEVERLFRALGGQQVAVDRFSRIAEEWEVRYPLHSEILRKFLQGWSRREIVRYFVAQGLYEDTRVYACIKDLPRRLSEQLRIEQAGVFYH